MEAVTLGQEGILPPSILPPGRKTRALLAIVALSAPRPVLRARLADLLWSRRPEEQSRASLRQEIHRLLDVLEHGGVDILAVARDHLSLRPGSVQLDVDLMLHATPEDPAPLDLLQGELLEDLDGLDPAFDLWLRGERERLRDRARSVAEGLLRAQLDAAPELVIAAAERLLRIDRAHEGAWRAVMRAHAGRGERGLAIQAYERCRAVLSDLTAAAPSAETQRLLAEIRTGEAPASPSGIVRDPCARGARGARLGVLPFEGGGSDDEARLAQSMTAGLTAALARFRSLSLVAAEHIAAPGETGFTLGGIVQRVGGRLRVSAQLQVLRDSGTVLWGRHFDRVGDDLLLLEDEVAAAIAAQVEPEILTDESRHVQALPPEHSTPYELTLRAVPAMVRLEREEFMQAGGMLREAMVQGSGYAPAYAWSALWHVLYLAQGWAADPPAALRTAAAHAERAILLDPQDARAFAFAGHVRAAVQGRPQEALALYQHAIALNPNLAASYALAAFAHLCLGELGEAEREIARYKALSPIDPYAFLFDCAVAMIALLRGDFAAAAAAGRAASGMNPRFSTSCQVYLAALGHLGDEKEAKGARLRLLAIEPHFTLQAFLARTALRRAEDRDLVAAGLRLAGIPDGAPTV